MNPVFMDPDVKINMSLDEIIHLTRGNFKNEMQGKHLKNTKKKAMKRMGNMSHSSKRKHLVHSIPLLAAQGSGVCGVNKGLLNAENKRRIAQFFSNREMNSDLLKKSKEIIPAEYKLVKTIHGVERVLVPAAEYIIHSKKKCTFPRKLNNEFPCNSLSPELYSESADLSPPLIATSIYKELGPSLQSNVTAQTAEPEDDIVILDCPSSKKDQQEVIDVESNLPVDIVEMKKLLIPEVSVMSQNKFKTLNDRFTLLTGNSQF